ncbi:amidophosphoribosyltransferase [bacterium]|nr:amidophosphoribosyltransferase [bacterium]
MCGIAAVISQKTDISKQLVVTLGMLQHRGHDGAGIITLKNSNLFFEYKKKGLVSQIFTSEILDNMSSTIGIGHIRYTTQGSDSELNLMPITLKREDGLEISIVFNGNIKNILEIKDILNAKSESLLQTESDGELLVALFLLYFKNSMFDTIKTIQNVVKGAFSAILLTNRGEIISFVDNYGFRPLFWGKQIKNGEIFYLASSETPPLESFDYQIFKEMRAGDILIFNSSKTPKLYKGERDREHFCVFEFLYFSRPDSTIFNQSIAEKRVEVGKALAKIVKSEKIQPDIVIDIPSSGYFAALGFSEELNIPLKKGIIQNEFMKRSFILPQQTEREERVKQKFNIIKSTILNKKIAVIDDSIVRGTTAKHLMKQLKVAGAKEIYLLSASPKIYNPCYYGVDIAQKEELIVNQYNHKDLERYFDVDRVIFLELKQLKEIFKENLFCFACFDGDYPV